MILFLSPHGDDETLYGAFTIIRERPVVAIVTDGSRHEKRHGITIGTRRMESVRALDVLGSRPFFLGIPDDALTIDRAIEEIGDAFPQDQVEKCYAPAAYPDGNDEHNTVAEAAFRLYGERVRFYSTYTKGNPKQTGGVEIIPTEHELFLKRKALSEYESQIRLNGVYFNAAKNGSEYLA